MIGNRSSVAIAVLSLARLALGAEPGIEELRQRFHRLPGPARQWTGPLFWLHGDESRQQLETELAKVAEGGNGCFTTESRPHVDWLGEGWWRDLDICLQGAKRHGLDMWIFDEKWWPSGEVGGQVPARYGSKRLQARAVEVSGPADWSADGLSRDNLVAVIAGRTTAGGIDGGSLVELAGAIQGGSLKWAVPAGDWKVMVFTWAATPVGNRYIVDGASRDCVAWYLRTVFEPHYAHYKADFGKTIKGFFYDEPETHGDWGTEVIPLLKERGVDYRKALVAFKFNLAGEEQIAARCEYLDAFAEAWGRTMYGGMTRWCEARGVKSIGHWLEHTNCYVNPDLCAGNMFQLQKYSSMGAIDAVFDQFRMGARAIRDVPCWQTPKLGSSITHAYGKPDDVTMVEIFGARGQDLTYPEMKWWTDHMHVSGVNFLIPHSFNPRGPRDTDCPPYFYNGGFEPRWPLYRVFADYTSRLSLMLTGGRHVCPVALLFPGQAVHVGRHILPEQVSEALQDSLYDCDWIPADVFEQGMTLAGRQLRLRDESYRILFMPAAEAISVPTLVKAGEFFEQGGVVVAYGMLPSKSATLGRTAAEVARIRDAIWGDARPGLAVCRVSAAGGRSYLLPAQPTPEQLQQVLAGDAGVRPTLEVIEGRTDHWLHVLHRVKAGRDVFFIANQNCQGPAREFRLRITAKGEPNGWDAMRNETAPLPHRRSGEQVDLALTMEPLESVLLVFEDKPRPASPRVETRDSRRHVVMDVARDPDAAPARAATPPDSGPVGRLEGGAWVWYPDDPASTTAPPGTRCFRKEIEIPAGRKLKNATFAATADNSLVLHVNGKTAGRSDDSGEGWRNPVEISVRDFLHEGRNTLAIVAVNATDRPSPAGVLGRLQVEFQDGSSLGVRVDKSWKTSRQAPEGWMAAGFDDSAWAPAREVARFGEGIWGRLNARLTLSPVKADPFAGHFELPGSVTLPASRVYLEMADVQPETAARVTVNDQDAGGFIGAPMRIDIAPYLKSGVNTIRIEPFAPRRVQLVTY